MSMMLDIAVHEAAHAIIAKHFGAEVTELHFGGEPGMSRCHITPRRPITPVGWAAIAYAGFVAEQRVNPNASTEKSAGHDLRELNKRLEGATDATKKRVADWTRSLVTAHWSEIQHLANHLCDGMRAHSRGQQS